MALSDHRRGKENESIRASTRTATAARITDSTSPPGTHTLSQQTAALILESTTQSGTARSLISQLQMLRL